LLWILDVAVSKTNIFIVDQRTFAVKNLYKKLPTSYAWTSFTVFSDRRVIGPPIG